MGCSYATGGTGLTSDAREMKKPDVMLKAPGCQLQEASMAVHCSAICLP